MAPSSYVTKRGPSGVGVLIYTLLIRERSSERLRHLPKNTQPIATGSEKSGLASVLLQVWCPLWLGQATNTF